jgi:hypothetical protein
MRTPTNSGRVSLRVHTSPVTDATVCMRTFAPQRRDRHGPVSPKPDARTWPQRPKISKSLLHERSAKVFAILVGCMSSPRWRRRSCMMSTHGRFGRRLTLSRSTTTAYQRVGGSANSHLDPKPGPKLIGHHATDPLRWPARSAAETVAGQIFSVDTTCQSPPRTTMTGTREDCAADADHQFGPCRLVGHASS